jgi:hypothetical protein
MKNETCRECNKNRWAHYDQQEGPALLGYIMHKYVPWASESERKRIAVMNDEPMYPKNEAGKRNT